MTDRLYYNDSYLREFEARIIRRSDDDGCVYLDRTALYPASGGQPFGLTFHAMTDELAGGPADANAAAPGRNRQRSLRGPAPAPIPQGERLLA